MAGKFDGTTYTGDETDETVTGTAADEVILGNGGSDTLKGGAGDDTVSGDNLGSFYDNETLYIDKVYGGSGDDILINTALAPKGAVIDGGEDADTARILASDFANSTRKIAFALTQKGSYVTVDGKQTLFVTGAERLDFNGDGQLNLTGGAGDDKVFTYGNNAVLKGLGGNDRLTAGAGGILDGGAGDDTLSAIASLQAKATIVGGAGGADYFGFLNGANLALTMSGDAAKGMVVKSGGTTLASVSGIERISAHGSSLDDTLLGAGADDAITDDGGRNTIRTGTGDDYINVTLDTFLDTIDAGGGAADYLRLAGAFNLTQAFTMSGSLGSFSVKLGSATAATVKGVERVSITSGQGDDKLFGGALNDSFFVLGGADEVKAGDGVDDIAATVDRGLDRLDGGAGDLDRLSLTLSDATKAVSMSKSGSSLDLTQGGKLLVHATNMESLSLTGSSQADKLLGLSGFDQLSGGAGDDRLYGYGGSDTLTGGAGKDTLDGGDGFDTLIAGNGKPAFDPSDPFGGGVKAGALVADTLIGGAGIDTAAFTDLSLPGSLDGFGTDGVAVKLDAGRTVKAMVGKTVVATLSGIENLDGSDGNDTLTGDKTDNALTGRGGKNRLDGGAGNDTADYSWFYGYQASLSITLKDKGDVTVGNTIGQAFQDTLRSIENLTGSQNDDTLTGNKFDNVLRGDSGNDTLKGKGGNDTLEGDFGTDTLEGGDGNDTLSDFFGSATMTGGGGRDTFYFNFTPGPDVGYGLTIHTIKDFNIKDDTVRLSSYAYGLDLTKAGGHLADKFFKDLGLKGAKVDGDDLFVYNRKTGDLLYDADGSHTGFSAIKIANFENHAALTAADFIVL